MLMYTLAVFDTKYIGNYTAISTAKSVVFQNKKIEMVHFACR